MIELRRELQQYVVCGLRTYHRGARTAAPTCEEQTLAHHSQFIRAAGLMAAASAAVPVVGLATAPVLAQGLGVAGRGIAAAALAPGVLIVGGATLGMPEALTFLLAKDPARTKTLLRRALIISSLVGGLALALVVVLARPLGGGVPSLPGLIVLGTALAVPQLGVSMLRGAAVGRHQWRRVALERVLGAVLRLVLLLLLLGAGLLDVISAVLVTSVVPVVCGLVYLKPSKTPVVATDVVGPELLPGLLQFGMPLWAGSVAAIVISRLGPLLVTPLSDVRQLGLLVVAVTVADVPFIVSTSVRDVLFGSDSRSRDAGRLAATTRTSTGLAVIGALPLGITLPLWIEPLFGEGFIDAQPATWILLAATVCSVPGWMAGAGLSAWGRPAIRSAGLIFALAVNLALLLLLVPALGATGAAVASLAGALALSSFTVVATSRVVSLSMLELAVPRPADAARVVSAVRGAVARRERS